MECISKINVLKTVLLQHRIKEETNLKQLGVTSKSHSVLQTQLNKAR
jgi:hypothetical protein